MKARLLLLALASMLGLGPRLHAQKSPEETVASFTVTDPALEIQLWAAEPLFVNPTCNDIDHKGRVWVCESVNYRNKLMRKPRLNRPEGDRIVILEDTKGAGRADKATTFYQSPELLAPLGIAVAKAPASPGYKVYVCQSPDILVFEDKDGDGKADGPPKKLLTGFQGYDHDHGVHGVLIGPDGRLYFSVGDQGVRGLQSADGKGRKWTTNHTDCQAGTVWRCDLDGKNLELIAHNFRNEYEPCVDSFGTVFVSDNDDDGNQQTRICYVMPGGNYGYWPRGKGQTHWHEEQPGVVPKILRTYFGSPTGMCVYEGTLLPKKYWGQPLHADAGPRQIRCYHLKPKGAGYEVERNDLVTSTDNWFRPSDVCVAPDGSVFIADWYDPGVGGHGMGDTSRGRIYRLAPKGNKYSVPKVELDTKEGLLAAWSSPNLAVRHMALAKLQSLDPKAASEVLDKALTQKQNNWLRARALWRKSQSLDENDLVNFMLKFLKLELDKKVDEKDERFRLLLIRSLRDAAAPGLIEQAWLEPGAENKYFARVILNAMMTQLSEIDASLAVNREVLLALRDEQGWASDSIINRTNRRWAKDLIISRAKLYDGHDRFYLEAIGIAVGHHDAKRREIILADFDKHFPEWNDKVLDLIWELRPPTVLPRLEKRLADKSVAPEQQARIMDILAASEDVAAGKALLKALEKDLPQEARARALAHFQLFLPGKWSSLRQSPELAAVIKHLLSQPATRATGLALIGAAEKGNAVTEVAAIAQAANEDVAVRSAAVRTLGVLSSEQAIKALESVLKSGPEELRLEAARALGRVAKPQAMRGLQDLVRAKDVDPALREAAASGLAGSRQGTTWLLVAHARKQLPEAVIPAVARLLRNSPYPDLRNKALIAFPPPAKLDPNKLPSIAVLARRHGDPRRGQRVLSANKDLRCLACHTIAGSGGNVGPDLSVIGKKASRENLFESLLLPSKAVADQYVNWVVETNDGLSLTGLIVEEKPEHLIVRDANGKDTKVLKKDLASKAKSPNSIMPSDLLAYMTEDDLVDVVEYLFSLK
jgi:putative membrane-bound dehydrogenase-like protein